MNRPIPFGKINNESFKAEKEKRLGMHCFVFTLRRMDKRVYTPDVTLPIQASHRVGLVIRDAPTLVD